MAHQTLRRKLINAIHEVVSDKFGKVGADYGTEDMSADIADVVLSVINEKPAFDKKNADPMWDFFHGGSFDQSHIDAEKMRQEAFSSFESCLQMPGSWSWYSSKTAEEKVLSVLREHVMKVYMQDKAIFQKYQTWRTSPYARGAMSNVAIRRRPEDFVYSWSDFLASYAMNEKKLDIPVQKDDNDVPLTY